MGNKSKNKPERKLFRREQPGSKENLLIRIGQLERRSQLLEMHIAKLMTLAEGLSQIVIAKGVVTEEEYKQNIHEAMKKFYVTPDVGDKPLPVEEGTPEVVTEGIPENASEESSAPGIKSAEVDVKPAVVEETETPAEAEPEGVIEGSMTVKLEIPEGTEADG